MTIPEILTAVAELELQLNDLPSGAQELPDALARISDLEAELERIRSLQGPLVPDASSPPTPAEKTVTELGAALRDLRSAATAKR